MALFRSYGKMNEIEQAEYDARRKSRQRIIIMSVAFVVLIIVVVTAVAVTQSHDGRSKGDAQASSMSSSPGTMATTLKTICNITLYPSSCFDTLSPLVESSQSIDPSTIFYLSIQVAINQLETSSKELAKIEVKNDTEKMTIEALRDCQELMILSLERLNDTVIEKADLSSKELVDSMKTWLSSVITYQETCVDGFENSTADWRSLIKGSVHNSTEGASNSLAILSTVANFLEGISFRRRRKLMNVAGEQKVVPGWVAPRMRKLLQWDGGFGGDAWKGGGGGNNGGSDWSGGGSAGGNGWSGSGSNGGDGWNGVGSEGGDDWKDGGSKGGYDWKDGGSKGGDDWKDAWSKGGEDWKDGWSKGGEDWKDAWSKGGEDWKDAWSKGGDEWKKDGQDWYKWATGKGGDGGEQSSPPTSPRAASPSAATTAPPPETSAPPPEAPPLERDTTGETPNLVVAQDGSGDYLTITEAVNAAPEKSETVFVIYVKEGTYVEKVKIESSKHNILMYGDGMEKTIVSGSLNAVDGTPTYSTATFAVKGKGFMGRDMGFYNTAGEDKHQAVAMMCDSDLAIFYRCKFDAYQDTLYVHSGRQFYRECEIYGTVDFIFGNAATVLQKCNIYPRQRAAGNKDVITAQSRSDPNQNTGISIHMSKILTRDDLTGVEVYLGRPWKDYSTTVYMASDLAEFIHPEGWMEWESGVTPPNTILYGEYQNTGPGSNTGGRVTWEGVWSALTPDAANMFTVTKLLDGDTWIPQSGVPYIADL